MALGKKRADWEWASELLALTANINRDPKKKRKPWTAAEINHYPPPRAKRLRRKATDGGWDMVKKIMMKKGVKCVTRKATKRKVPGGTEGEGKNVDGGAGPGGGEGG